MEIKLWTSDRAPKKIVCVDFLQGMINRLVVGYYRYEQNTPPTQRNYLKRIESTLAKYKKSRNKEFLLDLANYAMREFEYPSMPDTIFKSTDSDGRRTKD